jgi:hypothetical protein
LPIDPNNTFALTNKVAILHMLGNNTTHRNPKFLQYGNSTYGIKIQYSSDWNVEGGGNPAIIASFYPQTNYAANSRFYHILFSRRNVSSL